jgi:hypothetical protein
MYNINAYPFEIYPLTAEEGEGFLISYWLAASWLKAWRQLFTMGRCIPKFAPILLRMRMNPIASMQTTQYPSTKGKARLRGLL